MCPICRVKLSKSVLRGLQELDRTNMFAEPVTEEVAKNYFDTVRNPMDLATMRSKAERYCDGYWLFDIVFFVHYSI